MSFGESEVRKIDKVDKTIEELCEWILRQLPDGKIENAHEIAQVTTALASLINVRAVTQSIS